MRRSSIMVAFATAAIICIIVVLGVVNRSPGPLSAVHGMQPELSGFNYCAGCHGADGDDFAAACAICHPQIGEQVAHGAGFHGTNPIAMRNGCGECHLEHLGPESPLVGDRAFRRSGFDGARAFLHDDLGLTLAGRHLEIDCDACHARAFEPRLEIGARRFIGLDRGCAACHEDPHAGKLHDCSGCHEQDAPFDSAPAFDHDERLPLVGGHAGVACQKCHSLEEVSRALYEGVDRGAGSARECGDCHEFSHDADFLEAAGDARGRTAGTSCSLCHLPEHPHFESVDWERSKELHDASGFRLVPTHEDVACDACHLGLGTDTDGDPETTPSFEDRFPGTRSQDDCRACHGDPHEGQFVDADGDVPSCTDCHEELHFVPHRFDLARHDATAFPLRGAHREVECDECHEAGPGRVDPARYPTVRRFRGTDSDCVSCHKSPHAGQFSEQPWTDRDCGACHGPDGFLPSNFTVESHAKTGFPLVGSHRAIACNTCHMPQAGSPKPPSVSDRVFHGTPGVCADCHLDVHDGMFDREASARILDGKTGCARCHTPERFEFETPRDFRHGFWTGFELSGAHADASCESCHPKTQPTHEGTRSMARAASTQCADCHQNPHAGQFRIAGKTECLRCHGGKAGWKADRFDHDRDSRFELGDDHRGVACAKCHRVYVGTNGSSIVRFKPLGVTCRSCHLWKDKRR